MNYMNLSSAENTSVHFDSKYANDLVVLTYSSNTVCYIYYYYYYYYYY